nr:hypothetical protein CFP56_06116 [Quercus suber]
MYQTAPPPVPPNYATTADAYPGGGDANDPGKAPKRKGGRNDGGIVFMSTAAYADTSTMHSVKEVMTSPGLLVVLLRLAGA